MSIFTHVPATWTNNTPVPNAATFNLEIKEKMTDIDTNLTPLPTWINWNPTYSASGAMTFTSVSTIIAKYCVIGKVCHLVINFSGTTGGAASNAIYFTLPVTADCIGWWITSVLVESGITKIGYMTQPTVLLGGLYHAPDANYPLGAGVGGATVMTYGI